MPDDLGLLVLAASGLFVAGIVKGAAGIGYASCALPLVALVLPVHEAIPLVLIPALATNAAVGLLTGHLGELAARYCVLYASMLPGVVLGALALIAVDGRTAAVGLGALIVAYALLALSRAQALLPASRALSLQGTIGLANGFVAGLTGSQVLPLIPYILGQGLDPDRTAQSINIAVLVLSIVTLGSMIAIGSAGVAQIGLGLVTVPLALTGLAVGKRLRGLFSPDAFKRAVLIVLALSGVGLILRNSLA